MRHPVAAIAFAFVGLFAAAGCGGQSDDTPEFRFSPLNIFVLGDYRNDSIDSRHNSLGIVPKANLTGVVYTVYWSKDFSRLFLRIR